MAARVDPNRKKPSDTEDHEFYLPSHVPYGSPECLLQVHEDENSTDQKAEIENVTILPKTEYPVRVRTQFG